MHVKYKSHVTNACKPYKGNKINKRSDQFDLDVSFSTNKVWSQCVFRIVDYIIDKKSCQFEIHLPFLLFSLGIHIVQFGVFHETHEQYNTNNGQFTTCTVR